MSSAVPTKHFSFAADKLQLNSSKYQHLILLIVVTYVKGFAVYIVCLSVNYYDYNC